MWCPFLCDNRRDRMKIFDKVEKVNIDDIFPYHNNPKTHPPEQIDKLCSSIKNYGFTVPIVIDGENEIIAGHGRYKAAQKLGLKELPVIRRDDLTDAEAKALRIADNKVAESEWDMEMLEVEFEAIEDEFTGFSEIELNEIKDKNINELEEDDFEIENEILDKKITKKGDLIELGKHKLLCGDSTKEKDLVKLMGDEEADMVFTDPPYNVDYEGGTGLKIENDNMNNEKFYNFLLKFYKNSFKVTKDGGAIYICHADSEGLNFRKAFEDAGWLMKQTLIWIKSSLVLGRQDYHWRHEPILYGWKPGAAHTWNNDRKQTTVIEPETGIKILEKNNKYQLTLDTNFSEVVLEVNDYKIINNNDDSIQTTWFFNKPSKNGEHPTMKPVKLVGRAIKNSSLIGELILDPFAGSGSTMIACEELGRKSNMIEFDPIYCDVIIRRYINYKQKNNEEVNIKVNGQEVNYRKYEVKE